jgi:hypothetical protein
MQQENYDVLMYEEEHRVNKFERENVVPRYIFSSPPYYWKDHENVKFEQRAQNCELMIHYVVK